MITIPRNDIVRALNLMDPIAGGKYGNIELAAKDGALTLRVWRKPSRHVVLTLSSPVSDPPGSLAPVWLNCRALLDCLRSVSGPVTLSVTGKGGLIADAGDARFSLMGQDSPGDFPAPIDGPALVVSGADLHTLIDRAGYCMAHPDNTYGGLQGMNLELADGVLTGTATDGNRLAWANVPASGSLGLPKGAILNGGTVAILRRLPLAGDVAFTFSAKMGRRPNRDTKEMEDYLAAASVYIEAPGVRIHDALTVADFPDWRVVIPAAWSRTVTVDRDDFATTVKRGGRMASNHNRTTIVDIAPGGLTLTSRALDLGSARATVPAGVEGEPLTIGFNRDFVLAALKAMPKGPVVLDISTGALGPVRVRSLVDGTVRSLLMPVRLN